VKASIQFIILSSTPDFPGDEGRPVTTLRTPSGCLWC